MPSEAAKKAKTCEATERTGVLAVGGCVQFPGRGKKKPNEKEEKKDKKTINVFFLFVFLLVFFVVRIFSGGLSQVHGLKGQKNASYETFKIFKVRQRKQAFVWVRVIELSS